MGYTSSKRIRSGDQFKSYTTARLLLKFSVEELEIPILKGLAALQ